MAQLVVCLLKLALCKLWSNWLTVPFWTTHQGVVQRSQCVFQASSCTSRFLGSGNNVQMVVL